MLRPPIPVAVPPIPIPVLRIALNIFTEKRSVTQRTQKSCKFQVSAWRLGPGSQPIYFSSTTRTPGNNQRNNFSMREISGSSAGWDRYLIGNTLGVHTTCMLLPLCHLIHTTLYRNIEPFQFTMLAGCTPNFEKQISPPKMGPQKPSLSWHQDLSWNWTTPAGHRCSGVWNTMIPSTKLMCPELGSEVSQAKKYAFSTHFRCQDLKLANLPRY